MNTRFGGKLEQFVMEMPKLDPYGFVYREARAIPDVLLNVR